MIKSYLSGEICVARDARVVFLLFNERPKVFAMLGKYIRIKWNMYVSIWLLHNDYLIIILDTDEKFNPFVRKWWNWLYTYFEKSMSVKKEDILLVSVMCVYKNYYWILCMELTRSLSSQVHTEMTKMSFFRDSIFFKYKLPNSLKSHYRCV